jgi:hypothetical protein
MTSAARKTVYGVLLVIMLMGFGYYFSRPSGDSRSGVPASIGGRSTNSGPAPASQGRLSSINEQAHTMLAERNRASAFYVAKKCYLTLEYIKRMQRTYNCDRLADNPALGGAYAECLKNRDGLQPMIDSAERSFAKSGCVDEHNLFPKYYESTKEAAKSGNSDAQLCYLQSNFIDSNGKTPYAQADRTDYQTASPKYIQDAFTRGDWRIVKLLSSDHHGEITGLSLYIPNIGTPETVYKMTRLLRLGASGAYAKQLDDRLDTIAHPDGHANPDLPQAEIAELDDWVRTTFSQYFAGSPGLTQPPYPCGVDTPAADTQ